MNITELMTQLKENAIDVSLSGNELKLDFSGDDLSDDLLGQIRSRKSEIINYLKKAEDEEMRIPLAPEMDSYPVSSPQYRSWIMSQLQDNHIAYNMPMANTFTGQLNVAALEYAFSKVQERHESMRTIFNEDEKGEVRQFILPHGKNPARITHVDLRGIEGVEEELKKRVRLEIIKPFSLTVGPILRASLFHVRDDKWVFALVIHHIAGDSWSIGVILKELMTYYYEYSTGNPISLPELRIQYKDYTSWMKSQLGEEILKADYDYWKEQLGGQLPALDIPGDRPRSVVKTYNGGMAIRKVFNADIYKKFRAATLDLGGTSFMGVISALNTLFYRYSHQEDIIIGFPIAGREHPDLHDQVGFYVNTLAVRTRFDGTRSYKDLLARVKQSTLEAYEHRLFPFDEMVNTLDIQWDKSRSAVFDTFVVLQPTTNTNKPEGIYLENLTIEQYVVGANNPMAPFELTFNFSESPDHLSVETEFNSDIYNRSTVLRMMHHLERIMRAISATPDLPLNELEFLDESEKQQLVNNFNSGSGGDVSGGNIARLFEARSAENPGATAIVCNDARCTYGELNLMGNQFAAFLKRHYAIQSGDHVVIKGHADLWVIMSVIAAAKLGVIYTLIDSEMAIATTDTIIHDIVTCAIIDSTMVQQFMKERHTYAGAALPPLNIHSGLVNVLYRPMPDGNIKSTEMYQSDWMQFFHQMDQSGHKPGQVFTAKRGTTFEIAVAEMLWALANGLEVQIDDSPAITYAAPEGRQLEPLDFSIFYFGNDGTEFEGYRMLLEGAKFADENGFSAVWTPERHFNAFGAPYPNPSVLGAALASITKNIHIRAGSVVVPLHNPIRIAEEWAIVDNLSGGRVGFACATGWHTRDFVFFPENHAKRHVVTYENIKTIQSLWRGDPVFMKDADGQEQDYRIYPRPVQKELPIWITSAGNIETFLSAGRLGYGLLTNLLHGTLDDLGVKISAYKKAYHENGHPPEGCRLVLMLHSYMEEDLASTIARARPSFLAYLQTSLGLVTQVARQALGEESMNAVSDQEMDEMLEYSFERYVKYASIIGTQETCMEILEKCSEIGVDEIACLIDFGVDHEHTMKSLVHLAALKDAYAERVKRQGTPVDKVRLTAIDYFNELTSGLRPPAQQSLAAAAAGGNGQYKAEKTITELFEDRAAATPDAVALVFDGTSATFREVNEAVNQLSHYLIQQKQVVAGDLVALLLNRTHWMPIAILAVLKTGAAYVPVDPEFPQSRIDYILGDSKCRLLLDEVTLDAFKVQAEQFDRNNPVVGLQPDHLAYVMYTSGSTGKPKGVMLEHRNITSFFENIPEVFQMQPGMSFAATTSYTFDISVLELLGALTAGMTLRMVGNTDPSHLIALLRDEKINVLQITPSRLNQLYEAADGALLFPHLKVLLVGGEAMTTAQYGRLKEMPGTQVYNVYGPTETTIWSTSLHLQNSAALTIGRPLLHEYVYIMNSAGKLSPAGITGEICIAGPGVARGYLNNPGLTAEKFVPNPFVPGQRMYRTGDMGRWLPDGNIEFWGRTDNQVKVRGYRIELGEIENVLQSHPDIDAAAVNLFDTPGGEKEIAAYITSTRQLNMAELRTWLGHTLPEYMIPGHYMQLPALPLNQSGKVDRKRLPDPEGAAMSTGVEYIAPRNEIEEKLVELWQSVLGRLRVGVRDNFFVLGGHSLRATKLAAQIHKTFNVRITMRDIFTHVILEDQARFVGKAGKSRYFEIERATGFSVSSGQKRLWLLSQFPDANIAYNMPGVNTFEGEMNLAALSAAFKTLVQRHESLRTVFRETESGELNQFLLDANDPGFDIAAMDMRLLPDKEALLEKLVHQALVRPFDLAAGPLVKCEIYQTDDFKWTFVYVLHHIIADAWSLDVIIKELLHVYNAIKENMEPQLAPITFQYRDYANWQQQQLNGGALEEQKQYWLKKLAGELPVLDLPADYTRPALKTYNGGVVYQTFSARVTHGLKSLCQQQGATLFMGLVASVNALFLRYTGQEDIILGTSIAGREHANLENQIGFYVNTLAFRTQFSANDNFRQLLSNVWNVAMEAYDNQDYPFDELINALHLHRDMSRSPLIDVMVVMLNVGDGMPGTNDALSGVTTDMGDYDAMVSKYDLTLSFYEMEGVVHLRLSYNSDIYSHETAQRMGMHLETILEAACKTPETAVSMLNFMTEAERNNVLTVFNDTSVAYPSGKTIHELFAEQVHQTPSKTALVFDGGSMTYQELYDKSSHLANYLRHTYQLQPDDLVGVLLDRSDKLLVAILAILRAGAGYVPLDADYPANRKALICDETAIKVLVTQTDFMFDTQFYSGPVFAIDVQNGSVGVAEASPAVAAGPANLAYVMFTSGSTGTPKGVMVEHRSVVRLVKSANYVQLTGDEILLSTGAPSFDATTFEYWSMLLNGGTLVLTSRETLLYGNKLAAVIQEKGVDTMWFTSGWLNQLIDTDIGLFKGLRTVLAGGDKLSSVHIAALRSAYPMLTIINGYGPTENTTFSAAHQVVEAGDFIPLGRPISNSTVYILDDRRQLLPVGVPGEICTGGDGLARGYLNQPELTAEKFVTNPWVTGTRMYHTGDIGRWLPDGTIQFYGRKDNQVKVRGYRVEPGEIETILEIHPEISGAAVVAKPAPDGNNELVAFIAASEDVHTAGLNTWLAQNLPDYMIPSRYVTVDELPLNANGKVDKKRLQDMEGNVLSTGVDYVAPRNEVEEKLVQIWQEVLEKDRIGINDNFFDAGGHSLKARKLLMRVNHQFDVNISLVSVFTNPTVAHLAEKISQELWLKGNRDEGASNTDFDQVEI